MTVIDTDKRQLVYRIFAAYHKPEYIYPDPLSIVRTFSFPPDQEIAALICSSLALGRVQGIMKAANRVLSPFPHPATDLLSCSNGDFRDMFEGFTYRFFGSEEIASLLTGIRTILLEYGSLEACFVKYLEERHTSVVPALTCFVETLSKAALRSHGMLLSSPEKGGASKRLHLFLRWVVRKDNIDPGCWSGVSPELLLYPMDTHMLRVAAFLGIPTRATADLQTALRVTEAFREIEPSDPVRYDFSLTRPGIHPSLSVDNEYRDS